MKQKLKVNVYTPNSIKDAIDCCEVFFDCDIYSKFRPNQRPTGKKGKMHTWYRKDMFKDEREFSEYLNNHFTILRDEIIALIGEKEYKKEYGKHD